MCASRHKPESTPWPMKRAEKLKSHRIHALLLYAVHLDSYEGRCRQSGERGGTQEVPETERHYKTVEWWGRGQRTIEERGEKRRNTV